MENACKFWLDVRMDILAQFILTFFSLYENGKVEIEGDLIN